MEPRPTPALDVSTTTAASDGFTPVPLIDMQRQYSELRSEINAAVLNVCKSGKFVLGPECQTLETALADYCHAPHAIACASGSDALLLALMAVGIGPGHEVVLPSYTFFATAGAVARLGATPVFVDIDPVTFNIDPVAAATALTTRTRAIIPVHLFGQCAEMAPLARLARQHNLTIIEDACQAIGAEYHGCRAGTLGDMAAFSFYPTKNLGGCGDGGLITTTRDDLAEPLKLLRVHGMQPRYYHQLLGINSRLDTLQAAVLNVKLPHLPRWTELRQGHARHYGELFARARLDRVLTLPRASSRGVHVWNQYVVRVPDGKRDALRAHLTARKVGTEIYYPVPLHMQKCFAHLACREGSLPHTEQAAKETLALPIFPELTLAEQKIVVGHIADFFGHQLPTGGHELRGPKFLKHGTAASESLRVEDR